jgi:hypothetical protein
VEEADGVREGILDEHALGIAGDELGGGSSAVVGEEKRGFVMAQVSDEDLSEGFSGETDGLFVDAGGLVLAAGYVEFDGAPG